MECQLQECSDHFGIFNSRSPSLLQDDIEPVAVHVRRTDYARYPGKHDMLQKEYYVQAARIIQDGHHVVFLIFSDDPEWCREQEWLKTLGELVVIVTNDAKDFVDLKVRVRAMNVHQCPAKIWRFVL